MGGALDTLQIPACYVHNHLYNQHDLELPSAASLSGQRKSIFPNDESLQKMLYLETMDILRRWTDRVHNWRQILLQPWLSFRTRSNRYSYDLCGFMKTLNYLQPPTDANAFTIFVLSTHKALHVSFEFLVYY